MKWSTNNPPLSSREICLSVSSVHPTSYATYLFPVLSEVCIGRAHRLMFFPSSREKKAKHRDQQSATRGFPSRFPPSGLLPPSSSSSSSSSSTPAPAMALRLGLLVYACARGRVVWGGERPPISVPFC
ncbi:hypothetical protein LX32DRAFT_35143 [Colletotrichum zoysiae]|uniref:Uncharacterized protein n=1 Tax=Colletotrichum zoysiae TaxID=1216348 RepID=A0AAD9M263_9PEZI|nr:hypothetical protein LX32DRAFT_35143 [Colletotrichum zoysiae]